MIVIAGAYEIAERWNYKSLTELVPETDYMHPFVSLSETLNPKP